MPTKELWVYYKAYGLDSHRQAIDDKYRCIEFEKNYGLK